MSSIYHIIFIAGCRIYHRIITGIFFFVSLKYYKLLFASAKQSASLAKSYCPVDNDKKLYSLCFSSFYLLLSFLPCSLYLRNFAKNTKRFLFLHNIKYTNYQEITIITGTFPLPTHELHLSFQARKESCTGISASTTNVLICKSPRFSRISITFCSSSDKSRKRLRCTFATFAE